MAKEAPLSKPRTSRKRQPSRGSWLSRPPVLEFEREFTYDQHIRAHFVREFTYGQHIEETQKQRNLTFEPSRLDKTRRLCESTGSTELPRRPSPRKTSRPLAFEAPIIETSSSPPGRRGFRTRGSSSPLAFEALRVHWVEACMLVHFNARVALVLYNYIL